MTNPIIMDMIFCIAIIGAGILGYIRGVYKAFGWIIKTAAAVFATAIIQRYIPDNMSGILSSVIIFAILRIIFSVIYSLLEIFFKLPIIKQTNGLAGAAIYICAALIILYIAISFAYSDLGSVIDQSFICRYFHDYNLWELIMGISSFAEH